MSQLKNIVQRLDWRFNPIIFIPLAILFQWDLQQAIALEKWKNNYAANIEKWLEVIGEFETMNSFANFAFNNSHFVFPQLNNQLIIDLNE